MLQLHEFLALFSSQWDLRIFNVHSLVPSTFFFLVKEPDVSLTFFPVFFLNEKISRINKPGCRSKLEPLTTKIVYPFPSHAFQAHDNMLI